MGDTIIYNVTRNIRSEEFSLMDEWHEGSKVDNFLWSMLATEWKGEKVALFGRDAWKEFGPALKKDGCPNDPWMTESFEITECSVNYPRYAINLSTMDYLERGKGQILTIQDHPEKIIIKRHSDMMLLLCGNHNCYKPGDETEELVGAWAFTELDIRTALPDEAEDDLTGVFCQTGFPISYYPDDEIVEIINSKYIKHDFAKVPFEGIDFYNYYIEGDTEE